MSESDRDEVAQFSAEVKKELEEMAKLGISVPAGAFKRVDNTKEMEEYSAMRVSDCADLLISLASTGGDS